MLNRHLNFLAFRPEPAVGGRYIFGFAVLGYLRFTQ
jgi:hypothetical protein